MKTPSILILALLLSFQSCKKINESIQRDIDATTGGVSFTIPVISTTQPGVLLGDTEVSMDVNAFFDSVAPEFDVSNIKNVKITGFRIDLLDSDSTNNFANLETVNVEIWTGTEHTAIASIPTNPNSESKSLILPITGGGTDLKNFITASSFRYKITGRARKVTTKPLKATVTARYKFTVGL